MNSPQIPLFLKNPDTFVFSFSEHYQESLTIVENGVTGSRDADSVCVSNTCISHMYLSAFQPFQQFYAQAYASDYFVYLLVKPYPCIYIKVYIILKLVFKKAYIGREYHLLVSFQYNYKYIKFIFVFIFIRRWVKEDLVVIYVKVFCICFLLRL